MGSSASAQSYASATTYPKLNVQAAVQALDVDTSAKPFGTSVANVASTLARPVVAATTAVANAAGAVFQPQPAQSVTLQFAPSSIATEAAWLYKGGWPLYALVNRFETNAPLDIETSCLATAVYFEARGESLEGQLAVARVVINRASSGRYPPDWCSVVKQPAQFSFVRHGEFPSADTSCEAWRKAEAVAEIAAANIVPSVGPDVLWYHADYVAPAWRHGLQQAQQIGAHIFYRS
ncbi:MAG TPA: cell wall hydrolase [Sphingomicrobium sp.]|jgi:spore germination cell wall hydrolase CwlJ-like protein|nr:cell wall hydrolase [Sphingomicrobium sp.]